MKYTSEFLRNLQKGKWQGILRYKDNNGKWKQTTKVFSTSGKTAAKKALAEWRLQKEAEAQKKPEDRLEVPHETTSYVHWYVDTLSQTGRIEPSTKLGYETDTKRIGEGFKGIDITSITPTMVQEWERRLMAERKLAPISVIKAHRLLNQTLQFAENTGDLGDGRNPCRAVRPPKMKRPEKNVLEMPQVTSLRTTLDTMPASRISVATCLGLFMALRREEICGLKWSDIDFSSGTLSVARSIGIQRGGTDRKGTFVKEPKTGGSARTLPIPGYVLESLKQRKVLMARDCLSLEVPFGENLYVEGYVDGRYYDPRQLSRDWTSLASSLGLTGTAGKRPTFHDLRHTWATVAIYEGIDIEAVSAYMGHASVAMTADEYATALPQAKARAASVMNEVLMKDAKETPDGRLPIGNDDQEDI